MENTEAKKNTTVYWILFFISLIVSYFLYQKIGGVTILMLPFICTFFAKALDIM